MRPWLALALVACGSGERDRTTDATPPDTATDVLPPSTGDAPPGAVTLHVTLRGDPVPNASVYFQKADSTVVAKLASDANGTAFALLPEPNGFVTVIAPRAGTERIQISTFANVQMSDALELELDPDIVRAPATEFHLTIDADPTAAVTGYRVFTTCGDIDTTPNTDTDVFLGGCNGMADMLVVSFDENAQPIGSHFHANQPIDGTPLALTGTYEAFANATVQYTSVPPEIDFVGANKANFTPRGFLIDTTEGAKAVNATASISLRGPVSAGPIALVGTAAIPKDGQPGTQVLFEWPAPPTIDLAGRMLPQFASAGTYEATAHAITWDEARGAVEPDFVRARVDLYRDAIPEGTAWSWRIVAPRDGKTVAFPRLPDDGFDFMPHPGDVTVVGQLTTASVPGVDPRLVRQRGFTSFKSFIAGASGLLAVQDLTAAEPVGDAGDQAKRSDKRTVRSH